MTERSSPETGLDIRVLGTHGIYRIIVSALHARGKTLLSDDCWAIANELYDEAVRAAGVAQVQSSPVSGPETETFTAQDAWNELVNKDDRTSPEEYPDHCLISFEELQDYMLRASKMDKAQDRIKELEGALMVFLSVLRGGSSYVKDAYELHVNKEAYGKAHDAYYRRPASPDTSSGEK